MKPIPKIRPLTLNPKSRLQDWSSGKISQEHLQKDLDDILQVLHELDTLPYKISRKMGAEDFGNVKGKKVKREKLMEVIVGWRKFVKDRKKMNGVC